MILFSGVPEYSDRKVIILPRYSIPCLPLSNTVVVCYGRVHCRIQSWIPGSVLFRVTVSSTLLSQRRDNRLSVAFIPQWIGGSRPIVALPKSPQRSRLYRPLWPPPLWATALASERQRHRHVGKPCGKGFANGVVPLAAEVGRSRHALQAQHSTQAAALVPTKVQPP